MVYSINWNCTYKAEEENTSPARSSSPGKWISESPVLYFTCNCMARDCCLIRQNLQCAL